MTPDHDLRSVTATPELVRAMTRDVTALMLRTRQSVAVWCLAAVVACAVLLAVTTRSVGPVASVALVAALPAIVLAMVLGTRRAVRRALTVAFAPGSTVAAGVDADELRSRSALGSSRTSLTAYRELQERGSAVVLRLRGSAAFVVLPRALFTDADLEALRDGIARG